VVSALLDAPPDPPWLPVALLAEPVAVDAAGPPVVVDSVPAQEVSAAMTAAVMNGMRFIIIPRL
jgi:hypothetical protein